jgi:hypothetical protein
MNLLPIHFPSILNLALPDTLYSTVKFLKMITWGRPNFQGAFTVTKCI